MLTRLSIKNFALIRDLEVEFKESFSVITGETGAGKSIILGALGLILGNRAESQQFPDSTAKCSIEGTFNVEGYGFESFFAENDLDFESTCIIRREITPQGKSRAFVNDTPVNLNLLKDLTSRLIDVHSQHQTLLLQETAFQLSVVDSVAKNGILLEKYRHVFKSLLKLNRERNELLELQTKSQAELDYFNFLFDELEKARLVEGEQTETEKEAEILSHAAEIKTRLFAAAEILLNAEVNVLKMLAEASTQLSSASRYMPDVATLGNRLRESILEIRDIAESADRLAEATSDDPERLEQLNSRLSLLYQLEQKHRVNSVEELIEVRNSIEHKISGVTSLADQIAETDKRIHDLENEREILANELTTGRQAVIPFIEEQIAEIITRLGMKDARFKVNLKTSSFTLNGKDEIEFLFSANKGAPLNEISKVASGGELSRLMLAVKSVISTKNLLPTIIFDEIDTGISGDIASRVGEILKSVSKNMQVIAITHLPQIAGKGSEHFKVFKFEESDKTFSALQRLDGAERVDELALMISGDAALAAARETAKELLRNN